jgi:hypothetical protein
MHAVSCAVLCSYPLTIHGTTIHQKAVEIFLHFSLYIMEENITDSSNFWLHFTLLD